MRRRDFLALTLPMLAGAGAWVAFGSAGPDKKLYTPDDVVSSP